MKQLAKFVALQGNPGDPMFHECAPARILTSPGRLLFVMAAFNSISDRAVTSHQVEIYADKVGAAYTVQVIVIAYDAAGVAMDKQIYTDTSGEYLSTDRTPLETLLTNLMTKATLEAT